MTGAPREAGPLRIGGYEIEGLLGQGGTSRVYVARHERLERRVALKLFEVRSSSPANAVPRLLREAKLLARLDHENVVRCFDYGEQAGRVWLVLELVDGQSLKERLDKDGPLDEGEALRISIAVTRALHHAHENGIVHRDVKPGNILLSKDGRVKLTDFGLAKGGEALDLTLPGTMIGTPQYLSPEQARTPRDADERSDLYSLGATLYHTLTGRPPHVGDNLTEVISDILFAPITPPERLREGLSKATSRVTARLLARDRARRPRDAAEARADLERAASPEADRSDLPGISWEEAGHGKPSRRLGAAPVAAVSIAVVALVAAWAWWGRSGDSDGGPVVPDVGVRGKAPPFAVSDLESGRLTPLEAWAALESASSENSRGDQRLVLEAAIRDAVVAHAGLIGVRATSAARREVAAGSLEGALDVFDAELDVRAAAVLGGGGNERPELIEEALQQATAEQRRAVADDLVGGAGRRANDEIEIELDRLSGELIAMVAARRYRDCLDAIGAAQEQAEAKVSALFAAGVRAVVPESRDARPSDAWRGRVVESYRAALDRIRRSRVERAIEGARQHALNVIEAWTLDDDEQPDRTAIAMALREEAERALGIKLEELPDEPGVVADAVSRRAAALDQDVRTRARNARQRLEAEVLVVAEEALAERDVERASLAAARLGVDDVLDPWLARIVAALPGMQTVEENALIALERSVGRPTEVRVRGNRRRGTLDRVDRSKRLLSFLRPRFDVSFDEIETAGLVELAGTAAEAHAGVLLLHFAGKPADVDAELTRREGAAGVSELASALADRRASLAGARSDLEATARKRLAEFDTAVSAQDAAAIARLGGAILVDASLRGLDPIAARHRELQRAVEQAERDVRTERARDVVRQRTRAVATFHDDGTVELAYGFKTSVELDDFELPGSEWAIRSDALTSVPPPGRTVARDLFVNRPGLFLALPFDAEEEVRVSFDVELPYEQPAPTLFGLRVLSTTFIIRSFGDSGLPGQANAWRGDLDDFRDHVFEPSLGETRPRKKGAVREFSLRRGERYRFELSWAPGECLLKIDGDSVYRFRDGERPRASGLEIRSRTPIKLRDLRLIGTIPGTERRLR